MDILGWNAEISSQVHSIRRIGEEQHILIGRQCLLMDIPDDRVQQRLERWWHRGLIMSDHNGRFDFWAGLGALRSGRCRRQGRRGGRRGCGRIFCEIESVQQHLRKCACSSSASLERKFSILLLFLVHSRERCFFLGRTGSLEVFVGVACFHFGPGCVLFIRTLQDDWIVSQVASRGRKPVEKLDGFARICAD